MTHPLTPREKVARALSPKCWEFYDRHVDDPRMAAEIKHEVAPSLDAADAILTALASGSGDHSGGVTDMIGSGDHAELVRLAEAFGPDEKWTASGNSVALSVDGLYACVAEANPEGAFSDDHAERIAAFIAAANPATVLAILAEIAALRGEAERREKAHAKETAGLYDRANAAELSQEALRERATEAERKLAEAEERGSDGMDRLAFAVQLLRDYVELTHGGHDVSALNSETRTFLSKEAERG